MSNVQPSDVIAQFKQFRLQQMARMERVLSFTPQFEAVFTSVSSAVGNDPVRNEPIARVSRIMADYQRRWGISLAPMFGPSLSLIVDSGGVLKLQDDTGEAVISDVVNSPRNLMLFVETDRPDTQRQIVLQEYLYEYVARQLNRAMQERVSFPS